MTTNVVELIRDDHQTMRYLLDGVTDDPGHCEAVLPLLSLLITAHERAEEDQVYPALRQAGAPSEVEHSQEEHLLVDQLLDEVSQLHEDGHDVMSKLAELTEALTHHLDEEEESILDPMDSWLDTDEQQELGQAFLDSRQTHLGEQSDGITIEELRQQAANLGMSRDTLHQDKSELKSAVRAQADK